MLRAWVLSWNSCWALVRASHGCRIQGRLPTIIKVQDTLVPTFAKGYGHMVRRPELTHASNVEDRCVREVTMCAFESQVAGLQAGVES